MEGDDFSMSGFIWMGVMVLWKSKTGSSFITQEDMV